MRLTDRASALVSVSLSVSLPLPRPSLKATPRSTWTALSCLGLAAPPPPPPALQSLFLHAPLILSQILQPHPALHLRSNISQIHSPSARSDNISRPARRCPSSPATVRARPAPGPVSPPVLPRVTLRLHGSRELCYVDGEMEDRFADRVKEKSRSDGRAMAMDHGGSRRRANYSCEELKQYGEDA